VPAAAVAAAGGVGDLQQGLRGQARDAVLHVHAVAIEGLAARSGRNRPAALQAGCLDHCHRERVEDRGEVLLTQVAFYAASALHQIFVHSLDAGSSAAGAQAAPVADMAAVRTMPAPASTETPAREMPAAPAPEVDSEPAAGSGGSLLPLKTGNSWSYRTTKGTEVGSKTQTVGELEMVGGSGPMHTSMAYRMSTMKGDGSDKTVSWQAELAGKVVRYRELAYAKSSAEVELEEHWEPYKLRVDGSQLTAGTMYTDEYKETKLPAGAAPVTQPARETWLVVAVDELVSVPAGMFRAVVIERVGATSTKRYWFARGVGKVKEQSGAQLEELTSFEIMP
jgi:hypothetical protein